MQNKIEIIQQWQAYNLMSNCLFDDSVYKACKEVGITSLQSYFYWSAIEKKEGIFDFENYDTVVKKINDHNLKWVPFLIFGPYYATPQWFQKSDKNLNLFITPSFPYY